MSISIHALVKRATIYDYHTCGIVPHFNPRPRKEGDADVARSPTKLVYFNPRPRKEGDHFFGHFFWRCVLISIHALVKRATSEALQIFFKLAISIHALVKRATQ